MIENEISLMIVWWVCIETEMFRLKCKQFSQTRIVSWLLITVPSSLASAKHSVGAVRNVVSLLYFETSRQRFLNRTDWNWIRFNKSNRNRKKKNKYIFEHEQRKNKGKYFLPFYINRMPNCMNYLPKIKGWNFKNDFWLSQQIFFSFEIRIKKV